MTNDTGCDQVDPSLLDPASAFTPEHKASLTRRCGQQFLLLDEAGTAADPSQSGRVPQEQRRIGSDLGHVPDCHNWQPGDLVLTCPATREEFDAQIWDGQLKERYAWKHARWTHAAVYVGDWQVCHAIQRGIRIDPVVSKDLRDCLVRVRRMPDIEPITRERIALAATKQIGYGYDMTGALLRLANAGTDNVAQTGYQPHKRFCSQLYLSSWCYALRKSGAADVADRFADELRPDLWPAALSLTGHLQDVPVKWVPVSQ